MADQEKLLVKIAADISELKTGMRQAKDEVSKFNDTIKGLQIGAAALVAGQKIVGFLKDSAAAAAEAEAVTAKLTQALRQQGVTSTDVRDGILEYSKALQKQSVHGDEAITGVQTTLVQLGRLEGEGLRAATQATLDLAAGLGVDLTTAANLVGKAAAGSTASFSRYGLVVKSTGDKARDFQGILDQISSRFGGQARTEAETYSGSVKQLRESFGDLQEEIGNRLTPILGTAASQWTEWIRSFTRWIDAGKDASDATDLGAQTADKLQVVYDKLSKDIDRASRGIHDLTQEEMDLVKAETGVGVAYKDINGDLGTRLVLIKNAIDRNREYSDSLKLLRVENEIKNPTPKPVDPVDPQAAEKARRLAEEIERVVRAADDDRLQKFADRINAVAERAAQQSLDNFFALPIEGATELERQLRGLEDEYRTFVEDVQAAERGEGPIPENWIGRTEEYKQKIHELRQAVKQQSEDEKKAAEERRAQMAADREAMRQQEEVYRSLGDAVASVFQDVALEGEDMGEAVKQALRAIAMDLVRIAIARIIANAGVTGSNVAARDSTTSGMAGVATGLAAFAMVAAMAGKIPKFAEGGVVGGRLGKNDPNLIRVNRGEEIVREDDPRHVNNISSSVGGGDTFNFHFNSVLPPDQVQLRQVLRDVLAPEFLNLARQRMI